MKKMLLLGIAVATLTAAPALAGSRHGRQDVIITRGAASSTAPAWSRAWGSLAAVRANANPVSLIACSVTSARGHTWGNCSAYNGVDVFFCATEDPDLIFAIQSAGSASTVDVFGESGTCTAITVANTSSNL